MRMLLTVVGLASVILLADTGGALAAARIPTTPICKQKGVCRCSLVRQYDGKVLSYHWRCWPISRRLTSSKMGTTPDQRTAIRPNRVGEKIGEKKFEGRQLERVKERRQR